MSKRPSLDRVAGAGRLGGAYVLGPLVPYVRVTGTMSFSFSDVPAGVFNDLMKAVRDGFTVSRTNAVAQLCRMFNEFDDAPKCPMIGYLGKRELTVCVPTGKMQEYRDMLVAAAAMVDIDLSLAVNPHGYGAVAGFPSLGTLYVESGRVKPLKPYNGESPLEPGWKRPTIITTNYKQKRAERLRPMTSKLSGLIRGWGKDSLHYREPMLEWLLTKPTFTYSLVKEGKS